VFFKVFIGDVFEALKLIPAESVDCIVTSPPYWGLRDYGVDGQIGLEPTPQLYIKHLVQVSQELKRILKPSGSYWLNLGDTYCGGHKGGSIYNKKQENKMRSQVPQYDKGRPQSKPTVSFMIEKQKLLMPHRVAIALQDAGWICRNDVVWFKPSHMPSSVKDRLTNSFEFVFHFVKRRKYFYDLDAIREKHKTGEWKAFPPIGGLKQSTGNKNLTYSGNTPSSNPLGKNPGDAWDGRVRKRAGEPKSQNPSGIRSLSGSTYNYKHDGKNPGDAWRLKENECAEELNSPRARVCRNGYNAEEHFYHPIGKNPSDFWRISPQPFPEAHFATFPLSLVRRPLLATCPQWVCKKCGKPRERITKPTEEYSKFLGKGWHDHKKDSEAGFGHQKRGFSSRIGNVQGIPKFETIGWTDCGCGAGFKAGTVLDPFLGSGTTLQEAMNQGKNGIGIELNPAYASMIMRRLNCRTKIGFNKFQNGQGDVLEFVTLDGSEIKYEKKKAFRSEKIASITDFLKQKKAKWSVV